MEVLIQGLIVMLGLLFELVFSAVVGLLDLGFQNGHWRVSFAALFGILLGLFATFHLGFGWGLAILVGSIVLGIIWDHYDDHSKD